MTQFHSSGSEFSPALCRIKSLPWKLTAKSQVLRIPTSVLHFKAFWFLAQVAVGQVGKRTSFVFVFVFVSVSVFVFSAHKWLLCQGEKELCSYFHCRQICLQLVRPKAQGRRRRALISNGANFCAFSHFSPRPPESFSQKCNSVKSKHFCLMKGNNVLCWRHQSVFQIQYLTLDFVSTASKLCLLNADSVSTHPNPSSLTHCEICKNKSQMGEG